LRPEVTEVSAHLAAALVADELDEQAAVDARVILGVSQIRDARA